MHTAASTGIAVSPEVPSNFSHDLTWSKEEKFLEEVPAAFVAWNFILCVSTNVYKVCRYYVAEVLPALLTCCCVSCKN